MKKIDILNFITDFRKSPNAVKSYKELLTHLGAANESALNTMLVELKASNVLKETESSGEKSYRVSY
jgi:hypothetical protein